MGVSPQGEWAASTHDKPPTGSNMAVSASNSTTMDFDSALHQHKHADFTYSMHHGAPTRRSCGSVSFDPRYLSRTTATLAHCTTLHPGPIPIIMMLQTLQSATLAFSMVGRCYMSTYLAKDVSERLGPRWNLLQRPQPVIMGME
jgi:hypothetical protein